MYEIILVNTCILNGICRNASLTLYYQILINFISFESEEGE